MASHYLMCGCVGKRSRKVREGSEVSQRELRLVWGERDFYELRATSFQLRETAVCGYRAEAVAEGWGWAATLGSLPESWLL